jgi:hypothetical protein
MLSPISALRGAFTCDRDGQDRMPPERRIGMFVDVARL